MPEAFEISQMVIIEFASILHYKVLGLSPTNLVAINTALTSYAVRPAYVHVHETFHGKMGLMKISW